MAEVWDLISGNVVGDFDSVKEAEANISQWLRMDPNLRREDFGISSDEEHTHTEEQLRKATDALSGVSETHRTTEGKT